MNALFFLQAEHRRITQALVEIQATSDLAVQVDRFGQVRQDLERHMEIEEAELYGPLAERAGFEDLTEEAYDDHQELRDLLREVEDASEEQAAFADVLEDLIASLEHHVEEEEGEFFPKAETALGEPELEAMGQRLERARAGVPRAGAPGEAA